MCRAGVLVNVILALFNLVPVPPLDGGRIATAVLRRVLGESRGVATERALVYAGVVLMLIEPQELPGVSFQMSFSAVIALIAGYDALRPWLRRLHGKGWRKQVGSHIVALALTSALAGTASLPYGAYHFGHIQLWYIPSNMIAVPLTAFWTMPLGLIALFLLSRPARNSALLEEWYERIALSSSADPVTPRRRPRSPTARL